MLVGNGNSTGVETPLLKTKLLGRRFYREQYTGSTDYAAHSLRRTRDEAEAV